MARIRTVRWGVRAVLVVVALSHLAGAAGAGAGARPEASAELMPAVPYVAAQGCPAAPDAAARPSGGPPARARYEVCSDQVALVREALTKARDRKRLLVVIVGASWCGWCAAFQAQLAAGEVAREARGVVFDTVEIAVSTVHKGAQVRVPSGDIALAALLARAPGVQLKAVPFLAVIDPGRPERVAARNLMDLSSERTGKYDPVRLGAVLSDAKAYIEGRGAALSEPGPIMRRLQRWWYR